MEEAETVLHLISAKLLTELLVQKFNKKSLFNLQNTPKYIKLSRKNKTPSFCS